MAVYEFQFFVSKNPKAQTTSPKQFKKKLPLSDPNSALSWSIAAQ